MKRALYAAMAFLLAALPASAAFHLWKIVEVYTNHDGSVQYIELFTDSAAQNLLDGHQIEASSDGVVNTFTFNANIVGATANQRLLIATPGFGALEGAVAPDYALPGQAFFNPHAASITINFPGADAVTFSGASLPKNGSDALHVIGPGTVVAGPNTPTNFAGSTGAVSLPPTPPAAGDFNGDGRSDVLWRNASTGENYLYPMNGTAILAGEGYLRTVAVLAWQVAGIGDFDGDGKADVLWRSSATGENYVYFMDGTTIKPGEGYLRTVASQDWRVAGTGDFDGDGKDDILWRNSVTGENYLYPMDGLAIKPTEGFLRTVADLNWKIAGVADIDGDGKADVLWRNSSSGQNYLYPMDGTAIKPGEGFLRTVPDTNWQVAGTGDFDGDGKADILWRHAGTGENYLYPMDGLAILGSEGYVRMVADVNWEVKGTGDYDGDGKADVLWRHAVSGENYLYPMNGAAIKATEGYLRTVAPPDWQIQSPPLPVPVPQPPLCVPQADAPDASFLDTNCDGIDGDASASFFVATTGNDGNAGGKDDPFRTIQQGVDAAFSSATRKHVLVSQGTYLGSVTLRNGVSVFGKYNAAAGWARSNGYQTTITGVNNYSAGAFGAQAVAVFGASLSQAMTLADLIINAPSATGTSATGQGRSSFGVLLQNVSAGVLTITRVTIDAGNGTAGEAGSAGTSASSTAAAGGTAGGNANQAFYSCNNTSRGSGGAAGTNVASGARNPNGGAGGAGGTMDSSCSGTIFDWDLDATSGQAGFNAAFESGSFGGGGWGGGTCSGSPVEAENGAVTDGDGGNGATGQQGRLVANVWQGNDGTNGTIGNNGSGGGGGGGSGGCDSSFPDDSYGAGGGGGGAGGARAPAAGGGGKAGGGSFGVYLISASPTISNTTIVRGSAGRGGNGGTGGIGQAGGLGAPGGLGEASSPAGGKGGDGGRGGHSGGGGGGAGGISAGILQYSSSVSTSSVTYSGGSAGAGGSGGAGALSPLNGTIGTSGSLHMIFSCSASSGC